MCKVKLDDSQKKMECDKERTEDDYVLIIKDEEDDEIIIEDEDIDIVVVEEENSLICSLCKIIKVREEYKEEQWKRNENIRKCNACIEEMRKLLLESAENEFFILEDESEEEELEYDDFIDSYLPEGENINSVISPRNYSKLNLYTTYMTKYKDRPDLNKYFEENNIKYKQIDTNFKKEFADTNLKLPPLENIVHACSQNGYKILEIEQLGSKKLVRNFVKSYNKLEKKYKDNDKLSCYLQPSISFHGTKASNWKSIKKRGLLVPSVTNGVIHSTDTGWYGRGVYFAPTPATAQGYARANNKGESGIFVCLLLTGRGLLFFF
eukprot:TRINITY_DN3236_c0_g1_i1.p1 TRINITY_DN3236_c0_g1~~TRINITY_DN3236_c0_g1_i1.p1  ORF type:complete len:322 (-),score=117.23 TRINITY_DN3236_c0_g1_i1:443-1408(-)